MLIKFSTKVLHIKWQSDNTTYIYIKYKVKLATIVEGNPKVPFSIATTPRCRGGRYSFPGLLYFTLDPYLIMLSVKQGGIKYHFLSFGMTRPGIEPRSPGPLANTLTARPNFLFIYERSKGLRERDPSERGTAKFYTRLRYISREPCFFVLPSGETGHVLNPWPLPAPREAPKTGWCLLFWLPAECSPWLGLKNPFIIYFSNAFTYFLPAHELSQFTWYL